METENVIQILGIKFPSLLLTGVGLPRLPSSILHFLWWEAVRSLENIFSCKKQLPNTVPWKINYAHLCVPVYVCVFMSDTHCYSHAVYQR